MSKKLLKVKGPDGKWQTVASYEIGQYGPRVGINKPAARALLEGEGWVNCSVFTDDREKPAKQESRPSAPSHDFSDEIPF